MRIPLTVVASLALLAGCMPSAGPQAVTRAAPEAEALPPLDQTADGQCFARETTPAVYEQVPGQVRVVPEQRDADGTVLQPPIYRNGLVPRLVKPRGETRFRAPCPNEMTPAYIATLQRALYARGYLRNAITGQMDTATQQALRQYQRERGLDSAQLSLDSARELGISAVARDGA